MRVLLIGLAVCFLAGVSYAADGNSFVYSRTTLKIVPKQVSATPSAPKENQEPVNKPTEILPHTRRVAKEFTVDVRSPQFLTQSDFIYFQPFTDNGGMLILIDPPQTTSLKSSNMLAKIDVLFLTEDGLITKIAPDLSLKNLAEPIDSEKPIKAFLFLKGGMTKASDIRPGDQVENALFKTHPVVEESAEPKLPEQPK